MIKMHPVKFFLMYPYLWYFPYKKEYTIEQAEKEHLVYGQLWEEPIPSGKMNTFREGFKSKIQEGDKLYLYRSPIRNWFRFISSILYSIASIGSGVDIFQFIHIFLK